MHLVTTSLPLSCLKAFNVSPLVLGENPKPLIWANKTLKFFSLSNSLASSGFTFSFPWSPSHSRFSVSWVLYILLPQVLCTGIYLFCEHLSLSRSSYSFFRSICSRHGGPDLWPISLPGHLLNLTQSTPVCTLTVFVNAPLQPLSSSSPSSSLSQRRRGGSRHPHWQQRWVMGWWGGGDGGLCPAHCLFITLFSPSHSTVGEILGAFYKSIWPKTSQLFPWFLAWTWSWTLFPENKDWPHTWKGSSVHWCELFPKHHRLAAAEQFFWSQTLK